MTGILAILTIKPIEAVRIAKPDSESVHDDDDHVQLSSLVAKMMLLGIRVNIEDMQPFRSWYIKY